MVYIFSFYMHDGTIYAWWFMIFQNASGINFDFVRGKSIFYAESIHPFVIVAGSYFRAIALTMEYETLPG